MQSLKEVKLKQLPKLDFEPTSKDFEKVDIFKLNKSDQIVGKPSKYLVDIIKRFWSNKWAVFFLFLFLLLLFMAIVSPYISSAMGYSAKYAVRTDVDTFIIINLPARIISGSSPTKTVYSATSDQIALLEKANIIVGTPVPTINGLAWKVTYRPYDYSITVNGEVIYPLKDIYPILGTDGGGIDIWAKLWTAAGNSFLLAFIVAVLSIAIGVIYGSIAGAFAGKWLDIILMRFVEIINGVPTIVWILILGIVFNGGPNATGGTSLSSFNLAISLIFILWISPAIHTRIYILKNKDVEYVQATKTLGGSTARVIFLHMLPVVTGRVAVIFVNLIPTVIFYESSLVFLGLKSTSDIALGVLLYQAYTVSNLAQIIAPIVVFATFTISAQIIANALNDAIDPRVVGRQ